MSERKRSDVFRNAPRDERRRLERRAKRGGLEDRVRALAARVASGELTEERVRLAASLWDPAAMRLEPEAARVDWSRWRTKRDVIEAVGKALGDERGLAVAFSLDCLEHLEFMATDPRTTAALEAVKRWLRERSPEALTAVMRTVGDAEAAESAAWNLSEPLLHAAHSGDRELTGDESMPAFVARAVANIASTPLVGRLAHRAAHAVADCVALHFPDEGRKAFERDQQRARLAAYALGEVVVPSPRANPSDPRRRRERRAQRAAVERKRLFDPDVDAAVKALEDMYYGWELLGGCSPDSENEFCAVAEALGEPVPIAVVRSTPAFSRAVNEGNRVASLGADPREVAAVYVDAIREWRRGGMGGSGGETP